MIRNWTLAALAVCLLLPAAAVAQDTQTRTRPRPRVRVETRNGPFGVYTFGDKRGRIGVIVDTKADAAGDKIGARIEGITPGGPAEKAGLKAGDVITRFNTTALGGAEAEEDEASGPGMKLIELARRLEPGDSVSIEYRRGTDSRKATLVAEDLGVDGRIEMPDMGHMEGMFPKMEGPEARTFTFAFGPPWGGIEMVSLNPDLGDYFGTREGVLVVRAPEDSSLALKGGDVIVSIGGRKPGSPEQAMRILRSYDTGETVTMDVLRKQKHVAVTWKVPDEERRYRNLVPRMHEEPSWFRLAPKFRSNIQVPVWKIRDVIRTSRAI
jgi:predicted metalloprotease with PDZ domain